MLHLLIDTSVLRQDPQRKSAAFQVVGRIGNARGLKTHIPDLVRREFLSYRDDEYVAPLREIDRFLNKMLKKPMASDLKKTLENQAAAGNGSISEAQRWIEDDFAQWCDHIGAEVHTVAPHHGQRVIDAYFSGSHPFKSPKNRQDFPDAFIFECAQDISGKEEHLHVVAADRQLRESCASIKNISVYESLDDFVRSAACQSVIKDADAEHHFAEIIELIKARAEIVGEAASKKIFDALVWYTFRDSSIPDDNNEATISVLDVPTNGGLIWDEAEYYGDGVISMPFEFEMTALADFYIFKSDWYCMPEDQSSKISISEYDNKHYFEAEQEFELHVRGTIAISLDLSSAAHGPEFVSSLRPILDAMQIEMSEIEEVTVITDDPA